MHLTRNEMIVQNQLLFFVVDDMITQKKIQILLFIGGRGTSVNCQSSQNSCYNRRTKFRNTHWPEKRLTTVEDIKPWKQFCKTSLTAREQLFSKSVDKKSVCLYET